MAGEFEGAVEPTTLNRMVQLLDHAGIDLTSY